MEKKKPTNKEIVAKVEALTRVNNIVINMVDNLGDCLKQYIEFKKDAKDFHEYQKELLEIRKRIKGESNESKIIKPK